MKWSFASKTNRLQAARMNKRVYLTVKGYLALQKNRIVDSARAFKSSKKVKNISIIQSGLHFSNSTDLNVSELCVVCFNQFKSTDLLIDLSVGGTKCSIKANLI